MDFAEKWAAAAAAARQHRSNSSCMAVNNTGEEKGPEEKRREIGRESMRAGVRDTFLFSLHITVSLCPLLPFSLFCSLSGRWRHQLSLFFPSLSLSLLLSPSLTCIFANWRTHVPLVSCFSTAALSLRVALCSTVSYFPRVVPSLLRRRSFALLRFVCFLLFCFCAERRECRCCIIDYPARLFSVLVLCKYFPDIPVPRQRQWSYDIPFLTLCSPLFSARSLAYSLESLRLQVIVFPLSWFFVVLSLSLVSSGIFVVFLVLFPGISRRAKPIIQSIIGCKKRTLPFLSFRTTKIRFRPYRFTPYWMDGFSVLRLCRLVVLFTLFPPPLSIGIVVLGCCLALPFCATMWCRMSVFVGSALFSSPLLTLDSQFCSIGVFSSAPVWSLVFPVR